MLERNYSNFTPSIIHQTSCAWLYSVKVNSLINISNKLTETLRRSFDILVVCKLRCFELFADANPLLNGLDLNLQAYCILVGRVS